MFTWYTLVVDGGGRNASTSPGLSLCSAFSSFESVDVE